MELYRANCRRLMEQRLGKIIDGAWRCRVCIEKAAQ